MGTSSQSNPLSSRREFLAATGPAAGAASTAAVKGTRTEDGLFRIDVQSHMYPPPVLEFMMTRDRIPRAYKKNGTYYTITGEWHRRVREAHMDVNAKLAAMDEAGIEMTALSINDPGPERFGDEGRRLLDSPMTSLGTSSRRIRGAFSGWLRCRFKIPRPRVRNWIAALKNWVSGVFCFIRTWHGSSQTSRTSAGSSSALQR